MCVCMHVYKSIYIYIYIYIGIYKFILMCSLMLVIPRAQDRGFATNPHRELIWVRPGPRASVPSLAWC